MKAIKTIKRQKLLYKSCYFLVIFKKRKHCGIPQILKASVSVLVNSNNIEAFKRKDHTHTLRQNTLFRNFSKNSQL